MTHSTTWRSAHIFIADPLRLDSLLGDLVLPALAALPSQARWFFIRYGEGGPHLRVRLGDVAQPDYDAFCRRIEAALAPYRGTMHLSGFAWPLPAGAVAAGRPAFYRAGTIEQVCYTPETARYGGAAALPLNESLFCLSSRLAAQAVAAKGSVLQQRQLLAFDLMLATAATLFEDTEQVARFFNDYAGSWQQLAGAQVVVQAETEAKASPCNIDVLKQRLELLWAQSRGAVAAPASMTSYWIGALKSTLAQLRALYADGRLCSPIDGGVAVGALERETSVARILASQMHMMSNRLGITPTQEFHWSKVLAGLAH